MKSSANAETPEIVYCDNHVLVAVKPAGLLTQPDESGSPSLEEYVKKWVKEEYGKPGEVFLHCIHRIDRPVSGLVLFARTSKALTRLNELSRLQEIQRFYIAEIEGILPEKLGRLEHYLIHGDHRAHVAKATDKDAKQARLTFEVLHYIQHTTLVKIELETGRYHQIRAQFSAIGHPIVGDKKYKSQTGDGKSIHLHCAQLFFNHPVTKELLRFESPAPFA
jgi:23S rRNA pseudouridine1911/1915/1917 synthase